MADIKINGATPSGFYYGGTAASAVYYGSTKLWEPAPAGAVIGGKTYPTVTMPDGHEWLAVNLDYAWSGLSVPTSDALLSTSPQALYYDYDETTYGWNGLKRGLLYNQYAVLELESNKATLCPGWHVPTSDEWSALVTAIGGSNQGAKLKSTTDWSNNNGNDDYGFAGFPSGAFARTVRFVSISAVLHFWTQTSQYYYCLTSSNQKIYALSENESCHYSVRLIRDY